MEFTLPFLAHDLFKFNEMEQGKMFGLMGTISSLIQGGYVRRFASKKGEKKLVLEGLLCGVLGLLSLAVFIPTQIKPSNWVIWTAIIFLSYTSATVISCLTALLSLVADSCQKHYQIKATVLGNFRSYGQLGRCLGPVIACSIYWLFGPKILYYFGALGMALTYLVLFKMPSHIKKVTKTE
jgi:MFS family permease